jgi:hypothetical protein
VRAISGYAQISLPPGHEKTKSSQKNTRESYAWPAM